MRGSAPKNVRMCGETVGNGWGCTVKNNNTIIIPATSNVINVQKCTVCVKVGWILYYSSPYNFTTPYNTAFL